MHPNEPNGLLNNWLELANIQAGINARLERALEEEPGLSLNEFYVLHFLSLNEKKKLRLQQLQERVGLSQSAMSRLVVRMEAPKCGALRRHMCEDDRRGVYTEMTELGADKLERARRTVDAVLRSLVEQEGLPDELRTFLLRAGSPL
ncbi:MarR family winged helix-turn-helix transcriptional regulator [Saccharibacillus alkalitolerans]|uniref:MarR family transcriptional regulator n=1 Tax=Saccharibacillus alkalitolerans TaxID=2705290 RepID=A0ABX0F3G0_9BACL|nr:MarR family transcriptional regulator [Saccharibacillus alkalitolerans]NGZ74965.1 MarR family transcriptional regulator [Saccharibacillus alkalitolerans]